jgi:hypothetical protein
MQQSIIENKGITRTIINNNGNKDENEIKWDAKYDGKKADINMNFSKNCKKDKMHIELNNMDLSRILGVRPIPIPLDKRLKSDFLDLSSDSDSDSDSEDEIIPTQNNDISSSQLEEDLAKLLNIKTLRPNTSSIQKQSYKPEPYLFRVNVPRSKSSLNRDATLTDEVIDSKSKSKPRSKSDSELLTVSEMLFDPAFDLSAPPIQLREPTHISLPSALPTQLPSALSSLTPESLVLPTTINIPFQGRLRPLTAKKGKKVKNGKEKKSKARKLIIKRKNAYKTPAPKTLRVHLTSNKSSRKSKSKSKSNTAIGLAKKLGFL